VFFTINTLPRDISGSGARVLELVCVPWAASFNVRDDVEDDEEAAMCNTLEHGLAWVRRAFDELILPATSVNFFCANDLFLIFRVSEMCGSPSSCSGQTLTTSSWRRLHAARELRMERALLEMQLVMAQVAAATSEVSEASTRATLEAAK
jgi:hypothetical protein